MQRWVGPAAAGLLVIGVGALWLNRAGSAAAPEASVGSTANPVAGAAPAVGAAIQGSSTTASINAPDAPSWKGTAVDGDIHLDDHGNIIPDRTLRNLFDYLLTARGELSMDQIKQRLVYTGQAHGLSAAQLVQLTSDFGRYLDYLDALPQVALTGTDAEALRRTFDARLALRRGTLGIEMAEGFFAEEEARDRYEIDTVAIRRDSSLTPEARTKALTALQGEAPSALRDVIQRSATVSDLAAETERLKAAGADTATIQALREREVGSDAAQRLATLDAERAQWQARMTSLRDARERILANQAYAPEDRQRQVDDLIAKNFSEEETARVRAQLELPAP